MLFSAGRSSGGARRFEACCQLTLSDVVGVADKCGVISG